MQASGRQLEERRQPRGGLELRNRVEFLERVRERIGETPGRPWSEFLDCWIEVEIVDATGQMLRDVQLTLDEGLIDNQLRAFVRKAGPFPRFAACGLLRRRGYLRGLGACYV